MHSECRKSAASDNQSIGKSAFLVQILLSFNCRKYCTIIKAFRVAFMLLGCLNIEKIKFIFAIVLLKIMLFYYYFRSYYTTV